MQNHKRPELHAQCISLELPNWSCKANKASSDRKVQLGREGVVQSCFKRENVSKYVKCKEHVSKELNNPPVSSIPKLQLLSTGFTDTASIP